MKIGFLQISWSMWMRGAVAKNYDENMALLWKVVEKSESFYGDKIGAVFGDDIRKEAEEKVFDIIIQKVNNLEPQFLIGEDAYGGSFYRNQISSP